MEDGITADKPVANLSSELLHHLLSHWVAGLADYVQEFPGKINSFQFVVGLAEPD
jgi:hypothetical protein